MKSRAEQATVVEYLVDYEGPQLLLLKTDRGRNMLAHSIPCEKRELFFGCEVPEKVYNKYFDCKADLHYAFQNAFKDAYFFFDLRSVVREEDQISLTPATATELSNDDVWPKVGIFSRSHTSVFNRTQTVTTLKTYKIDGKWGASDFSHFYGKMSDLYSLFAVINRLNGATATSEKKFLAKALEDRLWRGGGSYNGFYGDLDARNSKHSLAPLEVSRIQYASPGHIDLRGDKDALAYTSDVVTVFDGNARDLSSKYNEIYRSLQKAKLLKAKPDAEFPSKAIETFVLGRTNELARSLKLENIDEMYEASNKNNLVFAKLVLSIYRRASELYTFEDEGRIQRT